MDEPPTGESPPLGFDAQEVARVATLITAKGKTAWTQASVSSYGQYRWQPDLVATKARAVLHVHLTERLRPYVLDRMQAAYAGGHQVHVAADQRLFTDPDTVLKLAACEAQVHLLDDGDVKAPRPILLSIALERLLVPDALRRALGAVGWEVCGRTGTKQVRGRRFEHLLAFLFSQVKGFEVFKTNLRTKTEEIDVVVRNRSIGGRVWAKMGPLVLIEGKRRRDPAEQHDISAFRTKMQGKHGQAQLGFVCSWSGFTTDAEQQVFRFASEPSPIIVLIGPDHLKEWVDAPDSTACLEDATTAAIAR